MASEDPIVRMALRLPVKRSTVLAVARDGTHHPPGTGDVAEDLRAVEGARDALWRLFRAECCKLDRILGHKLVTGED